MKRTFLTILLASLMCFIGCELDGDHGSSQTIEQEIENANSNINSGNSSNTGLMKLNYCWGGFNGSRAVEDPQVQIKNLKIGSNGMSYSWAKNDMRLWGYAHTDAKALACLFYYDEATKQWNGGKFDWISSSRLTRDFVNIKSHYNGWQPDKFFAARKHCFVIVSGDGKKRTNVIFD